MQNVYSIFDQKGSTYEGLYTFVHDVDAIRFFDSVTLRAETKFFAYPEDFSLVCLGTFDDRSGALVSCENHHRVITSVLERKAYFVAQKQMFDAAKEVFSQKENGDSDNA